MQTHSHSVNILPLLLLGSCIVSSAQQLETVRLICLPSIPLAISFGQTNGIFERYGIHIEARRASDAEQLRNILAQGEADVAQSSVENAIVMDLTKSADVVIVMGGEASTGELIVQPEIRSIKDLRGKTVLVDGTNTFYALSLRRILHRAGLEPDADYELKVGGLAADRLNAMLADKKNAATIQKPPSSLLSEKAGMMSLGKISNLLGTQPAQGLGAFTLRLWAQAHSPLLERYIAAVVESQRWLMAPDNAKQVIETMRRESHLSADVAERTYETSMAEGWQKDARFDPIGFQIELDLQKSVPVGVSENPLNPTQYYDLSYYDHALRPLFHK